MHQRIRLFHYRYLTLLAYQIRENMMYSFSITCDSLELLTFIRGMFSDGGMSDILYECLGAYDTDTTMEDVRDDNNKYVGLHIKEDSTHVE
jgi:hypothetical protein